MISNSTSVVSIHIESGNNITKEQSSQSSIKGSSSAQIPGSVLEDLQLPEVSHKKLASFVESTVQTVVQNEKKEDYFSINITSVTHVHIEKQYSKKDVEECKKRLRELEKEINRLSLEIFKNEYCIATQEHLEKQVEKNPQAWDILQKLRCEQVALKGKQVEIERYFRKNKPPKSSCVIL